MKKNSIKDYIYTIVLLISSILCLISFNLIVIDQYNAAYGIFTIFSFAMYITFYFLTLYLNKKVTLLVSAISYVPLIIFVFNSDDEVMKRLTIFILIILLLFLIYKIITVVFKKGFNFEIGSKSHRDFDKKSIKGSKNLDKTKTIIMDGKSYSFNYAIKDGSKGMLLYLGTTFPLYYDDVDAKFFGNDDVSNDFLMVYENHAFICQDFQSFFYYFDLNDLVSYTLKIVNEEGGGGYHTDIIIELKDGSKKEFGGYSSLSDDVEDIEDYINKKYSNVIKNPNMYIYEKGYTYEIGDKITISSFSEYSKEKEIFDVIEYDNIKSKEEYENVIVLYMNNGDMFKFFLDESSYKLLANKLKELNK